MKKVFGINLRKSQMLWIVKGILTLFIFAFPLFAKVANKENILELETIKAGFLKPTDISFFPGSDYKMIILEKEGKGKILNLKNGKIQLFLDLSKLVVSVSEEGLLGIAFHPDFKKNRLFYLNYTIREKGQSYTVIGEFFYKTNTIIKNSSRIVLKFQQPFPNHNGGQITFGPDGYLYIATGDGGYRDDPKQNGQNTSSLLGKILRINPYKNNKDKDYEIPLDNPFVKMQGAFAPEIWAYGFRNPWRISFDRLTGELYASDVGQDTWEEVDLVVRGGNYGWNIKEGNHCFQNNKDCGRSDLQNPIYEYNHEIGNAITGGYVYRGKQIPDLYGFYLFGDFVTGKIFGIKKHGKSFIYRYFGKYPYYISTFGQNAAGEIYLADYNGGIIYQVRSVLPEK